MNLSKFLLGLGLVCAVSAPADAQLTISGFNGLTAIISASGAFSVNIPAPQWQFLGSLGAQLFNSRIGTGTDNLGAYQELAFDYLVGASNRSGSIRTYAGRPLVMFAVTYNNGSANSSPFPVFTSQPGNLFQMSFNGVFAFRQFGSLLPDSPSIYFDSAANTYIVSPASDYMVAWGTGISSQIPTLPAGLTHRTALGIGADRPGRQASAGEQCGYDPEVDQLLDRQWGDVLLQSRWFFLHGHAESHQSRIRCERCFAWLHATG
jgi:hypothetical protein